MLFGCSSSGQSTTLSPACQSTAAATALMPSETLRVTAMSVSPAPIRRPKRRRAEASRSFQSPGFPAQPSSRISAAAARVRSDRTPREAT